MPEQASNPTAWTEHGDYHGRRRLRRIEPRKYEIFPELAEWFTFDQHLHVVPPGKVEYAVRERRALVSIGHGMVKIGSGMIHDRYPAAYGAGPSVELAIQDMNRHGIDVANITQADEHGFHNDYVAECLAKYPDRFIGTACVDFDFDDLTFVELEEANRKGMRVLNFLLLNSSPWIDQNDTPYGEYAASLVNPGFRFNALYMQRFWNQLAEWRWAISVDIPRRVPDRVLKQILGDLEEIVQQYPTINFIEEHFCFPSFPGTKERMALLRYPNVYTELGCASHGIYVLEDSTVPSAQDHLRLMMDEYNGEDSLMFGTDYPYVLNHATYWQVLDWIFRQCRFLNNTQRQKILGLNGVKCHHLEGLKEKVTTRKKQLKDQMGEYYDPYM